MYLAPSHELPLVDVSFTFRGGEYLETPEQAGLASTLGAMMTRGGTETMLPEELDERFDFLAARVTAFVGAEWSRVSLDCLRRNFDEAFELFMELVRTPGFDDERLRVHVDQVLEGLSSATTRR